MVGFPGGRQVYRPVESKCHLCARTGLGSEPLDRQGSVRAQPCPGRDLPGPVGLLGPPSGLSPAARSWGGCGDVMHGRGCAARGRLSCLGCAQSPSVPSVVRGFARMRNHIRCPAQGHGSWLTAPPVSLPPPTSGHCQLVFPKPGPRGALEAERDSVTAASPAAQVWAAGRIGILSRGVGGGAEFAAAGRRVAESVSSFSCCFGPEGSGPSAHEGIYLKTAPGRSAQPFLNVFGIN